MTICIARMYGLAVSSTGRLGGGGGEGRADGAGVPGSEKDKRNVGRLATPRLPIRDHT